MFLLIFFCNIPFVFFAGKIALLAVVHQLAFEKKPEIDSLRSPHDDDFANVESELPLDT